MKKALIALGVAIVLAVALVAVLPSLVPADRLRREAVTQVKDATGRDLAIDGKVSVSVFPALAVQMSDVALSSPAGFHAKDLIRLGALDIRLKLMPLLSGRVEVDSFVLVDPVVTLETDRQGRTNWSFASPPAASAAKMTPPAASAAKAAPARPSAENAGGGLPDIHLGDVRIENGKVSLVDDRNGSTETFEALNLKVGLSGLDAPLSVKGSGSWHGKALDLDLDLTRPRVAAEGKGTSALALKLSSEPLSFGFSGELAGADLGLHGEADLAVPSVRGLAAWATGKPLDLPGSGLGPLSVKGRLSVTGSRVAFTQAKISLDSINGAGELAVDAAGSHPAVKGRLDLGAVDVNPYLPPETAGDAGASPAPAGPAARQDWSDAGIDASALRAADLDFTLTAQSITVRKIKIGRSALTVALHGGRLTADVTELALYEGGAKGRLSLDGAQPGLGLEAAVTLSGVQAAPFLTNAANFSRLEGTARAELQVSGRGHTQRQLVSSLSGKGSAAFTDGAIRGVNLAAMVRNVATAFTDAGGAQKTDFAELSDSWTISGGVLTSRDLLLKSPLLRIEGAGTVDLPRRTLSWRVEPKVAATLEGQGGSADAAGLMVPVIVEGPWNAVSWRPDLAALARGALGQAIQGKAPPAIQNLLPPLGGGNGPLPINPGALFGR